MCLFGEGMCLHLRATVDGKNPVPVTGTLSHYLPGLIDPRWCRISSITVFCVGKKRCDSGM